VRSRTPHALALALVLGVNVPAAVQGPAPHEGLVYTLLTADGQRLLPARRDGGEDMVTLADLAAVFPLTVREDALAGGLTLVSRRRSPTTPSAAPTAD